MNRTVDVALLGRSLAAPEVLVAAAGIILFWMTIVQPESIVPHQVEAEIEKRDLALYSPQILKDADNVEAMKLLKADKLEMAIRKANEMASSKPHDVLSNLAAGNVLYQVGDKDEGFRLLKRSVALAPRSRYVRLNLADKLADAKRYDDAVAQYKLIAEAYPHWAQPHEALANIYMVTGQPALAAEELDKALEVEPNNGALRKQKGLALGRAGKGRKGLDEYLMGDNTELTAGPPRDVKQMIGYWGSLDRAIFEMRRQLGLRPDDPNIKLNLGRLLMYTGQITDAKQYLTEARKKAPTNPEIHRNLALVLQRLGETNLALSEFMLSINLEKNKEKEQRENP